MKTFLMLLVMVSCLAAQEKKKEASKEEIVFREPFTLRVVVDKEHYYEEKYEKKIPYVFKNDVYLFVKEKVGVNLEIKDGKVFGIRDQPDLEKADVTFALQQPEEEKRDPMMMLTIKSRVNKRLYMGALMTVPGRKGIYPTSILPLEPQLSNFESWPHAIVQLVIRDISFEKKLVKTD